MIDEAVQCVEGFCGEDAAVVLLLLLLLGGKGDAIVAGCRAGLGVRRWLRVGGGRGGAAIMWTLGELLSGQKPITNKDRPRKCLKCRI